MNFALAATLSLALILSGCGRRKAQAGPLPPPPATGAEETGLASWYGHPYHGRAAANGEIYDMEKLTAAHRTLSFGTWVRVVNLDNLKSVDVRIIDRGPFVEGRVIDLSHAAARAIDLIGPGVARVQLQIISRPAQPAPGFFAVQVGAFQNKENAERLRTEMTARFGACRVVFRDGSPAFWRVLVGREATARSAARLAGRIRNDRGSAGFVVREDVNDPEQAGSQNP